MALLPTPTAVVPNDSYSQADSRPCRVVFCWAEISGYMTACLAELAGRPDADPLFIAFASGRTASGGQFADGISAGLPCRLLESDERDDYDLVGRIVAEHRPDVVVLCGWFHRPYRALLNDPRFADTTFVMTMDTPWWGRLRQWIGRLLLRRHLRRIAMMVVTGERSWQYAIRMGLPQTKIRRGMYGVDFALLSRCLRARLSTGGDDGRDITAWPRRFLFAGRYANEKAIDILVDGYRLYRQRCQQAGTADAAWPLVCCGTGPLAHLLADQPGIENRGFVQPAQMRDELTAAGVFVLPSRYDPWPLALVEACAAGLPVIATEACGSAVEMIRPEYNGYLIPPGDAAALADAMFRADREYARLPEYGIRANQFAAAYSAEVWADRWERILREVKAHRQV